MNKFNKVLWGLVLIIIGVIIGLNSLGIANINIFFDGWWTLFIIIPCFIGLITKSSKLGYFIGFIIGLVLLLSIQGIINLEIILKLIVPFILVSIGISLIFNDVVKRSVTDKIKKVEIENLDNYIATFASKKVVVDNVFKGANVDVVFGGVDLDLRNAIFDNDVVIKTSCIFGGVKILVPKNVNVLVKSASVFGGVDNKINNEKNNKNTIYIDAFCMFGGVDIK